jgi:hypothetical protein
MPRALRPSRMTGWPGGEHHRVPPGTAPHSRCPAYHMQSRRPSTSPHRDAVREITCPPGRITGAQRFPPGITSKRGSLARSTDSRICLPDGRTPPTASAVPNHPGHSGPADPSPSTVSPVQGRSEELDSAGRDRAGLACSCPLCAHQARRAYPDVTSPGSASPGFPRRWMGTDLTRESLATQARRPGFHDCVTTLRSPLGRAARSPVDRKTGRGQEPVPHRNAVRGSACPPRARQRT